MALRFSRYSGGQWTAAQTIVERNDLFANWADFPSIVEDSNGALYAHWLQKSGKGAYSYDVRMATAADGKTFGESFLLNRDGKQAEHGFASLSPLAGGGVAATWLDGRNMKEGEHEHDAGDMTLRYAMISATGKIAGDEQVDARTCECCTTGMTIAAGGPVIVYRDRSQDEVRDIAWITRREKGWTEPSMVHADGWKIAACPVNGPQIDASGQLVVTAWFTAASEQAQAYVAFSEDSASAFGKRIRIDDGKPTGRVDVVLLEDQSALVTWVEQVAAGAEIRARRVKRDGTIEPSMKIADSSAARAAGFPRIARSGDEIWFTWTEQSETGKKIHVARKKL